MKRRISVWARQSSPLCGKRDVRILSISLVQRSLEILRILTAFSVIFSLVAAVGIKANWAASRQARSIRKGSSLMRILGLPTNSIFSSFKAAYPSKGSMSFPLSSTAMALTVKSRRAKSAVMSCTNSTSGFLLSP